MASVRELKRDINFLASEIVTQAYVSQLLFKNISDEEMTQILSNAIDFKEEFISKTNHPDGKDNPKLVKSYFSELRKDMVSKFQDQMNKIAEKPREVEEK